MPIDLNFVKIGRFKNFNIFFDLEDRQRSTRDFKLLEGTFGPHMLSNQEADLLNHHYAEANQTFRGINFEEIKHVFYKRRVLFPQN